MSEISRYTHEGEWARSPEIKRPRIVVTGIGLITPQGIDTESTWENIVAGKSAITDLDDQDLERLAELGKINHLKDIPLNVGVAGIIDREFIPEDYILSKNIDSEKFRKNDVKRMARAQLLSLAASTQALENANILRNGEIDERVDRERFGVIIGTSIGGMDYVSYIGKLMEEGKRVSPTAPLVAGLERVASVPSQVFELKGPKYTPTDACATGSQAVIAGIDKLLVGKADRMLVGGSDASVEQLAINMFDNTRALNRTKDSQRASIPFDVDRKGFVMAEGAGALVLETEEKARERNAPILAEVAGYGSASDAYHDTEPSGYAAKRSLQEALHDGGLPKDGMLYINAHGTSTPVGDPVEISAIREVMEDIPEDIEYAVSSTKSSMGHTMGASGAIEAGIAILALRDQILPPTLNLETVMREGRDMDLVPHEARPARIDKAGSKNFGFGGSGTHILFKRYED